MITLFETLTNAISGQFGLAIAASFAWGVLSILLSPCHLTSVPLVVGYISKQGNHSNSRNFLLALTFAVGVLASITLIGVVTASMGRLMGDVGQWSGWMVAALLVLFGLYLMDILNLDWMGGRIPQLQRGGHAGALLLGLVFGVGLGPCTFAFLAPVLTVVLSMTQEAIGKSLILLLAFGVGHSLVYALGGFLGGRVVNYVNWSNSSRGPVYTKRFLGSLMLLGGFYFAYTTL